MAFINVAKMASSARIVTKSSTISLRVAGPLWSYFRHELFFFEYAASVWDPHVTKQKQAIEKVQRRAARWVTNQHDSMPSVTAMLKELNWQPLELYG